MPAQGFFIIDRSLLDHSIWLDERFSKGQAWVDLIGLANHQETSILVGYKNILLKRGEVFTSQRNLSLRWGWHRDTVKKFLVLLETLGMVGHKTDRDLQHGYTIISISNYCKYQDVRTQPRTQHQPQAGHNLGTINNDNNDNNVNKDTGEENTKQDLEIKSNKRKIFKPVDQAYLDKLQKLYPAVKVNLVWEELQKKVSLGIYHYDDYRKALAGWVGRDAKNPPKVPGSQDNIKPEHLLTIGGGRPMEKVF